MEGYYLMVTEPQFWKIKVAPWLAAGNGRTT
jgi:hypothetical protein